MPNDYDFDKIVLTKDEKQILKKLKHTQKLKLEIDECSELIKLGLISPNDSVVHSEVIHDGTYSIGENIKRYSAFKTYEFNRFLLRSFLVPIVVTVITYGILELIKYLLR